MTVDMKIYRLQPIAEPADPGWTLRAPQGDVIVRARSTGEARTVAAEAAAYSDSLTKENDDIGSRRTSAFVDEKLYGVSLLEDSGFSLEGPPGVLEGLGQSSR